MKTGTLCGCWWFLAVGALSAMRDLNFPDEDCWPALGGCCCHKHTHSCHCGTCFSAPKVSSLFFWNVMKWNMLLKIDNFWWWPRQAYWPQHPYFCLFFFYILFWLMWHWQWQLEFLSLVLSSLSRYIPFDQLISLHRNEDLKACLSYVGLRFLKSDFPHFWFPKVIKKRKEKREREFRIVHSK